MSSLDYLDLCRLCLVKDRVSVPIFEGEGDVRQIFLKIAACLPVKVAREDKLPKKICNDCVYKVELFYQFWNTTVNAEKQLLQWLGEVSLEDKQGYVTNVLNPSIMKQEQSTENRLDGNVMQQVGEHQNNMGMGIIDNMGLGIPMMISSANQQQITSVPMDTSSNSVQAVQAVPGPSSQTTHNQISQNQTNTTQQEDEEESSEDEDNSDDECDGDEGLPVKEESEEDPSNRTIEPTTFVNVSLACDEAGPSGLQQQKISDLPEMPIPQPADGDPKSGALKTIKDAKPKGPAIKIFTPEEVNSLFDKMKKTNHDSGKNPPKKRVRKRNRPKKVKEPKKLSVCETCNLSFVRPSAYKRHMLKHSDLRPFKCDVCDKAFKTNDTLNNHKQIHQEIERACELCGFTTFNKISLALHIRRIHQRDFRYRCDQCEKGFMSNHDLQDHKASHSGKKTFVCETCGNAFWMRSALMTHKRKVHRILQRAPKQFQCNDCTKSFDNKDDLISHVGVHSQTFLCAQCGKKFATIYGLQMHTTSMHMGEKNYQCKVCLKTFARPATLRGHIITHTGQRPYKCDLCEQSFTQRSAMMTHRRKHPGRHPRPPPTFLRDYVNGLVAIKK